MKGVFQVEMKKMIPLFMDYCMSRQLRPKTMLSYEQANRLFALWLEESEGVKHVEEVKEMHVRRYIVELQTRGKYTFTSNIRSRDINHPDRRTDYGHKITNITINNYLRNIRVFFAWLVEIECLPKSPMSKIRELPEQRSAKEYMTDGEVLLFLKSLDKSQFHEYRDYAASMLMLDCGTRLGETLSIEMDQLDLIEKSLRLPADKTKGRKERTVFFSNKTATELRHWIQFKDRYCDSDYLFPVKSTARAHQVSHFESAFQRYLKRVGITKHISPHTLRNNFAKRCLMNGMDIYTLSRLLGHSSVKVTEKAYLDVTDEDIKKRYLKFSPIENIFYK